MRNGRELGRGAFGLVVVLSLACLIWTLISGVRQQVTLVPPPVSFNRYVLNITNIQLDVPKTLRQGEVERIRLVVNPVVGAASPPVLAQARLELLVAEITPGEQILTALSMTGPTRFEWEIQLIDEGELTGTLWLTFQIGEESQTVLAYSLAFQERQLGGASLPVVERIGWIGLLLGLPGLVWLFRGKK